MVRLIQEPVSSRGASPPDWRRTIESLYQRLSGKLCPRTAAAVLGHNFPDSRWYKDTYTLLQSKGLEPREDQGSWISKAFKSVGLG